MKHKEAKMLLFDFFHSFSATIRAGNSKTLDRTG
jgi:hypothetical protein